MGELAGADAMPPRGRRMGNGAVGVIDIGSNSVRLVLYERASRAPTVLFNEKVLAGLGEGLTESGRLQPDAIARTMMAVKRFLLIAEAAETRRLSIVATAAVRMAENGPELTAEIEAVAGVPVQVLTGRQEAETAAQGVLCGFWRPDGVVGDLGGGSLELIDVAQSEIGAGASYPVGTLRLRGDARDDIGRARKLVNGVLAPSQELPLLKRRSFYAVGGTWRSLMRLHMAENGAPLQVSHQYTVPADEMAAFCTAVARDGVERFDRADVVSKNRKSLVPWGAAVMAEVIAMGAPETVVCSVLGLREGLIFQALDEQEQRRDPLLLAAEELAILRARSPQNAAELVDWTGAAFRALGVDETPEEARLRTATCFLSDIGWRAHPDYRGDQALAIISNVALYGVDHPGRGYLALAIANRYGGTAENRPLPAASLCSDRYGTRAKLLAACFRLAYVLAPGLPAILPRVRLQLSAGTLRLILPGELSALDGERPLRRLKQLAKLVDADASIAIG